MIYLPHRRKAFRGGEAGWLNWDETSEDGCATDDIFCCMMSNTSAGGDETGQGGSMSGSNLVLTQSGNLAGATGTPPTRVFDGSDDYLTATTALLDAMIANANKTWTIILKVDNLTFTNSDRPWYFSDTTQNVTLLTPYVQNSKLIFQSKESSTFVSVEPSNTLSTSTEYYICMWADGTKLYGGFTTTRPTKLSDFSANDHLLFAPNTGDLSGATFNHATTRTFMSAGGAGELAGEVSYVILSKICLIDNAN
jgi:hypothetical protein